MKKMIFALVMMLTATLSASAMSYERARNEALFLTDKMAYELNLTDAQYEAAYEINLDYLMGVATYDDVYGPYWERRNMDMSYILYQWQWDAFCAATYFYRPLYWSAGHWHFGIYARYTARDFFYFGQPHFYVTYRGGHAWHMNGGRSWYHGRADHFRPAVAHNRQHFGMRSQWDRGDFRGRSHTNSSRSEAGSFRGSSSTRVTAGQNRGSFGRSQGEMRSSDTRSFGNVERGSSRTTTTTTAPTRSFGGNRGTIGGSNLGSSSSIGNRSNLGSSSSIGNRSNLGSNSSVGNRSNLGSNSSVGTRSNLGNSRSSGSVSRSSSFGSRPSSSANSTRSSSSIGSSRSSGSIGSSRSSSSVGRSSGSGGHFGGRR